MAEKICKTHYYPISGAGELHLSEMDNFSLSNPRPHEEMDAIDYAELCRDQANQLAMVGNYTLRQPVYRRLLHSLKEMSGSLMAPLSDKHRTQLGTGASQHQTQALLAVDSQSLLEYCTALTQILVGGVLSNQTEEALGGLLFDLIYLQADELSSGMGSNIQGQN